LKKEKDFFCRCLMCMGPDYSNALPCKNNACKGLTMCISQDPGVSMWTCGVCNSKETPNLHYVTSIQHQYQSLDNAPLRPNSWEAVAQLIVKSIPKLSPTHVLIRQMFELESKLNASSAAMYEKFGRQAPYLQKRAIERGQSIEKLIFAVKICECINAGCLKGHLCDLTHEVDPSSMSNMLWAGMDLIQCGPEADCYVGFINRYVPSLKHNYGYHDADVQQIENRIARATGQHSCMNPGCTSSVMAKLLKCARCNAASYCSKSCQVTRATIYDIR
jgi:hypothetical protein